MKIFKAAFLILFAIFAGASSRVTAQNAEEEVGAPREHADQRQLQSDEFLVDTAYLDDESEFQHRFFFRRNDHGKWSAFFIEEATLAKKGHQFVFSLPLQLTPSGPGSSRGLGDAEVEYSYALVGSNSSRITISPGVGVSVPTGSYRKGMGSGGVGLSIKLPLGVMMGKSFASNSIVQLTYTKAARSPESDRANTVDYEVGQSLVWFAKPRFNLFVEALWERSQEVIGPDRTANEHSFVISPAVRWTHGFKNGLTISPGVAAPIGFGPSHGERDLFFFIAFGHPMKRDQ